VTGVQTCALPICILTAIVTNIPAQTISFLEKQIETSSGDVVIVDLGVSEVPQDTSKILISIQADQAGEEIIFLDQAAGQILINGLENKLYENTLGPAANKPFSEYRAIIDVENSEIDFSTEDPFPVLRVFVPAALSGYGMEEIKISSGVVSLGYPKNGFVTQAGDIIKPLKSNDYPQATTIILNRGLIPPFTDFTDPELADKWKSTGENNQRLQTKEGLRTIVRIPGAYSNISFDLHNYGKWLSTEPNRVVGLRWWYDQNAAQSDIRFGITTREDSKPDSIIGANHSGLIVNSNKVRGDYQTVWVPTSSLRNELIPSAGHFLDPEIEYASPESITYKALAWQILPPNAMRNRRLEYNQAFQFQNNAGWNEIVSNNSIAEAGEKGLEVSFSGEAQGYALWRSDEEEPAMSLVPNKVYQLEAKFSSENITEGICRIRVRDKQDRFEAHYFNETNEHAAFWNFSHWFQLPQGLDEADIVFEFDAIGTGGKIVLEQVKVSSFELPEGINFPSPEEGETAEESEPIS